MASTPLVIAELVKNRSERLRVALDRWQDHDLLDIRVLAQLASHADAWSPTRKGVSIRIAQLPALIEALKEAEALARSKGLLDGARA